MESDVFLQWSYYREDWHVISTGHTSHHIVYKTFISKVSISCATWALASAPSAAIRHICSIFSSTCSFAGGWKPWNAFVSWEIPNCGCLFCCRKLMIKFWRLRKQLNCDRKYLTANARNSRMVSIISTCILYSIYVANSAHLCIWDIFIHLDIWLAREGYVHYRNTYCVYWQ